MLVGGIVAILRRQHGISVASVATAAGISPAQYMLFEQGRELLPLDTEKRIIRYFQGQPTSRHVQAILARWSHG